MKTLSNLNTIFPNSKIETSIDNVSRLVISTGNGRPDIGISIDRRYYVACWMSAPHRVTNCTRLLELQNRVASMMRHEVGLETES